jgi:hypothetical protein
VPGFLLNFAALGYVKFWEQASPEAGPPTAARGSPATPALAPARPSSLAPPHPAGV